jgi:antibiotic biosynthesis monooxygenase (ABM) superfamily enzyme
MYAVIGRVKIKPGHEQETLAMIHNRGVAMVRGFPGSQGGYWARTIDGDDLVQHLFWLFDDEAGARSAEATALTLREMPDAPATFVSVDVCEVVGQA